LQLYQDNTPRCTGLVSDLPQIFLKIFYFFSPAGESLMWLYLPRSVQGHVFMAATWFRRNAKQFYFYTLLNNAVKVQECDARMLLR